MQLSLGQDLLLPQNHLLPQPHRLPLKLRPLALRLSMLLRPRHRHLPSAQRHPCPPPPRPPFPPQHRPPRPFHLERQKNPLLRAPNDTAISKPLSKRKLQNILQSNEPCFQDCIVQEVLLMILEPVFKPCFSPKSHAFRPGRNAHIVIRTIRSNFAGYLWFLKGDLSEILDRVDPNVVMNSLEKGTRDKKILGLIKSAQ
ncbi:nuclear intron maturase 1, mitochondrial-like [Cajanus cajan]|uniref:nuclear intron maturase 1, mitochondrial-like n=1 Tax=Cajanus cajan TaxID=3821 RepID=UPI00098DCD39|nr:nuclear intron maturase 1, mitochondrial-like [Cajanus cajan]